MRTGVVAPYPVRTARPVDVARATVGPFVSAVRQVGTSLSGPVAPASQGESVAAKARAIRNALPNVSLRVGPRPVATRPEMPRTGSVHANQVLHRTRTYGARQFDAANAAYKLHQARATGSIWDIIFARQYQLRMERRPGWKMGYRK